ncbi:MAG: polysaccharide biosynthesis/export family protein [Proteobacteria bacterium]|nr:polysaccharide biosynthesis/export family protein [Pseudomonadota bacterium]
MQLRTIHIRFFLIAAITVTLLVPFLPGCSNKQEQNRDIVERYVAAPVKNDDVTRLNEQLFSAAQMNVDPSDYVLGAGDLLQITVFEADNLNTTVRVSSRGHVTLPLLGQIRVKGLTARETEIKIENLFRSKYIKNPHVSVFVEEHFSQRVTLVGQFKNPGTYDYVSKQRLLDVMALAGGLSDKAGRTVQVRRREDIPGKPNVFVVDLDRLVEEGRTELNIEINGGDVIFVPKAGNFFVDGAVRRPGSYPIRNKMILREALTAAGGIAPYALKDSFVLIRYFKDTGRKALELENNPENREMKIQDRDIIVVKSSTWGKLVHGTGINIGIPGFGFGYRDPEWRY